MGIHSTDAGGGAVRYGQGRGINHSVADRQACAEPPWPASWLHSSALLSLLFPALFGCGSSDDKGGAGRDAGPDAGASSSINASTSDPLAAEIGQPELIAEGFGLAESPLWDHCGHRLLFADVVGEESGTIHTADEDGHISVFATETSNANGMAFDTDGSLVVAQMAGAPGHIARRAASGEMEVLEPDDSPTLHTPDDLVVRSDGTIYFTDGDFYPIGNLLGFDDELPVYMLPPDRAELIAVATVSGPNGIELSPDERTLYVSAYGAGTIMSFVVAEDGTLSEGTPFLTDLANPDSLCLDVDGNLYVGVRNGLEVWRPNGDFVTRIPIPVSTTIGGTTSCTFGGTSGRTLFITSWDSLYKVEHMPHVGLDWLQNKERKNCSVAFSDGGIEQELDAGLDADAAALALDAGIDAQVTDANP